MNKKDHYKELLRLRHNEELLLFTLIKNKSKDESVNDVISKLNIHWKRVEYILDKWTYKGIYNWGVNIFFGWLEKDTLD